ncbi:ETC complex I subunit [Methyloceanibacter stevinii]|uniref:ETC complex I subunit n=1 Tax=Methyloceanibacter stevinii TaxID=1774970 RepID=A0A1E3VMX5_9HYPH|nr:MULTISPECIES: ETC complex I subunit [Methyloceanibacter]ODR94316.1 ETC complex I subunit [Methyloceanibacter stevinii]
MTARIYKPAQNVMQQGTAATKDWVLEYLPDQPRLIEPLMGWTSSSDTKRQIRLSFATKDEAIAYAKENGIAYRLEEPPATKIRPKSYAENFKYGRPDSWTH